MHRHIVCAPETHTHTLHAHTRVRTHARTYAHARRAYVTFSSVHGKNTSETRGTMRRAMRTFLCVVLTVTVAFTSSVAAKKRQEPGASDITYKQFHVDSLIVSRYAVTTVTSVVRNDADESKELDFLVQLPDTAFISNFSM